MTTRRIVLSGAWRYTTVTEGSYRCVSTHPSSSWSTRFVTARRSLVTTAPTMSSSSCISSAGPNEWENVTSPRKMHIMGCGKLQTRSFATSRQKKATDEEIKSHRDATQHSAISSDAKPVPPSNSDSLLLQAKPVMDAPVIKESESSNKNLQYKSWEEFTMANEDTYMLPYHKDMFSPEVHLASAPTDWTGYEKATPLWEELAAQIGVMGRPISVADYMRQCLTHPLYGYYTKGTSSSINANKSVRDFDALDDEILADMKTTEVDEELEKKLEIDEGLAIGGDFFTAPEVSSMFGESLGIWMTITAQQQGLIRSGRRWQYVEAGPGTASLLVDLMTYWSVMADGQVVGPDAVPSYVHLIEFSPKLKQIQKELLQEDDISDRYEVDFVDFGLSQSPTSKQTDGDSDEDVSKKNPEKKKHKVTVFWHDTLTSFKLWQHQHESYLPTFFIFQEFMDALPVYVFEKTSLGWRERLVDIALREDILRQEEERFGIAVGGPQLSEKLRLRLVLAPEVTPAAQTLLRVNPETGLIPHEEETGQEAPLGSVVEVNPEAILMTQDVAKIIAKQGGGALIIDYGQEGTRDTIRSYGTHKQLPFLSQPGNVDITADVDFAALKHAVNSIFDFDEKKDDPPESNENSKKKNDMEEKPRAHAYGPLPQGVFLMSMGVKERALQLAEEATDEQQEDIYNALVKLCDANEMGQRFKVLAITKTVKRFGVLQTPPGF